jgi:hypothetical protein
MATADGRDQARCLKLERCHNLEALPDISQHFVHLENLTLSLRKLKKLPRLPDSLKSLDIRICEAIVETCGRCEADEVTLQRTSVSN